MKEQTTMRQEQKTETLEKVLHESAFMLNDLRDLLRSASAVEAIVILDLIADAAKLQNRIGQFKTALEIE